MYGHMAQYCSKIPTSVRRELIKGDVRKSTSTKYAESSATHTHIPAYYNSVKLPYIEKRELAKAVLYFSSIEILQ